MTATNSLPHDPSVAEIEKLKVELGIDEVLREWVFQIGADPGKVKTLNERILKIYSGTGL
jgi:hypothetical protein